MYDPQSFFAYVLNAGGFWLSRDAPHRLMCDPQSFCIYVLNRWWLLVVQGRPTQIDV